MVGCLFLQSTINFLTGTVLYDQIKLTTNANRACSKYQFLIKRFLLKLFPFF